jgi:hypothetical protein
VPSTGGLWDRGRGDRIRHVRDRSIVTRFRPADGSMAGG